MIGTPTLDQLRVLLAIVEAGSLAGAARKQGRAVSAITYALDHLEAQLGLKLFTRGGTRRPVLTEAGQVVLAEARDLLRGVDGLKARVQGLASGLEAELSLAVDVMFPTARLVAALTDFQARFPTVTVRLHVEALGAVAARLADGTASLAIIGPLDGLSPDIPRIALEPTLMIPVAAPGHALAQPGARPGQARKHLQLVLTDRSRLTEGRDFGVVGVRSWRLADLGAKHALLKAGAGWGNMPEPLIAEDVNAGRLVRLSLPDTPAVSYPLTLIHAADHSPGPAATWLIDRLRPSG